MIKVYQVSRRYIMLFMHNNKYLPLTGLLTLLVKSGKIFRYLWCEMTLTSKLKQTKQVGLQIGLGSCSMHK